LLAERADVPADARAQLRSQAAAVDLAEAAGDVEALSRANEVYLKVRLAEGLGPTVARPESELDAFLAGLMRPGAGSSDASQP
jgi:hypothetical protein